MTFERSYTDKNGKRQYTGFIDSESLGKIVALCQQASEVIERLQNEDAQKATESVA